MQAFAEWPVTTLTGVGPRLAELLSHLHIENLQDLLFHLPMHYEDRTQRIFIRDLKVGQRALIEGEVRHTEITGRRRDNLICHVADETGLIQLRFFHFYDYQYQRLSREGAKIRCFGEVRLTFLNELEMIHPDCSVNANQALPNHLTPIYSTTKGLNQPTWRKLVNQALELLQKNPTSLPELLPSSIMQEFNLVDLATALRFVHQPPRNTSLTELEQGVHPAQQRLALEELLTHQLGLQKKRYEIQTQVAPPINNSGKLQQQLTQGLPFQLTQAQQRVLNEITVDLTQAKPMLRLVQGDVGSGKTIVSALAMLPVVEQGYQVAFMAPTELLVEQHFQNFKKWFEPLGISVACLTGSQNNSTRCKILSELENGTVSVVVGTHALFQAGVEFQHLALLVIDEQHRFGVAQRLALQHKGLKQGFYPHQLIMTATPIPRTLTMTVYADLDCSIIDEMPPGRKPITTVLIPNTRRRQVLDRVRVNCHQDLRQVYWVCTLIEESDLLQCQAAEATAKELQTTFKDLRIGLIHGRLKAEEKEQIMKQFKQGELNLLVATTVIEVGVDVPNASLMIIENPERLGLAQLHQLRGRVGRGALESHCVLLFQSPLSRLAKERLLIVRDLHDGFEIARKDLELRGPGEVLGTRQAGLLRFRIADLIRDQELLPQIHRIGKQIVEEFPLIIPQLIKRWMSYGEQYKQV